MTEQGVIKLMQFAKPHRGNPRFWRKIDSLNMAYNISDINGAFFCTHDDTEDEYEHPCASSIEAIQFYLKRTYRI